MIKFYCGVDGGGTSCRARIIDRDFNVVGEAKRGSANILLGIAYAAQQIEDTIREAASKANIDDLSTLSVGLALAGAEQKDAWQAFMKHSHPYGSMTLNTDSYGACLGAFGKPEGAIVIAGTGSVGLLLTEGKQYQIGGREFPISDQGGGAIMGLSLIQYTLLAHDGLETSTPLSQAVLEHFNHDLDTIVSWSKKARAKDYAAFSPMIFQFSTQEDPLACQLIKETAAQIERLIFGLQQRGATGIALMGSIGERILPWLSSDALSLLVSPQSDAVSGALLMAQGDHNLYSLAS